MKEISYTIALFLFCTFVYSQNNGGEIFYKVIMQKDSLLAKKAPSLNESMERASLAAENLKLSLKFNKTSALFSPEEKLDNQNKDNALVLAWCNCEKPIYYDLKGLKLLYNNREDKMGLVKKNEFLISDSIYNDWVLTSETKMIQKFTCYKATLQKKVKLRSGESIRIITAWYCPKLPFSFGPKGYGGLPGLILELQEKNIIFGVEKIVFSKSEIAIKKPEEGQEITAEAYTKLYSDRVAKHLN